MADLVTRLVPVLHRVMEDEFNVFDVMRHGTHEKQLSNVFAWLLDAEGTHKLGDGFQRVFIGAINRGLASQAPLSPGAYSVRQEVDISGAGTDIADLVLEDHETTIVVENYYTSDGHGHSFEGYWRYGEAAGKRGIAVMLCATENRASLTDGWEDAPVVVYSDVLRQLTELVEGDDYRRRWPEQYAFLSQLQRRYVGRQKVNDENLIEFIDVLCATGDARNYGWRNQEDAAINFADRVHNEAIDQFNRSRDMLSRVKQALRGYGESTLVAQVNAALGENALSEVTARYQGIYEWTINFHAPNAPKTPILQLKFGPSAWKANVEDDAWKQTVAAEEADYSRLFLTVRDGMKVVQSAVSVHEVLAGLDGDDTRLRDEVVALLGPAPEVP